MNQQLSLPLDRPRGATLAPLPRLAFPVPRDGGSPFDDHERFFEPWWPGALAFLRREGQRVEIHTEHLADPLIAFPELRASVDELRADGVIIEGMLLALDEAGRPDVRLLRHLLSGSIQHGVAVEGAFVASDLPYLEGRSLARQPFRDRRRQLAAVLPDAQQLVLDRGLIGEGTTLGRAVAAMGLQAISARRLEGRWRPGPAGDDWLRLRVSEAPAEPARPFLALLERLPLED